MKTKNKIDNQIAEILNLVLFNGETVSVLKFVWFRFFLSLIDLIYSII